ncbi:MAG TPA: sensor histidine kinase [Euzebyales bacterium]
MGRTTQRPFRHDALLYDGAVAFDDAVSPFLTDAVALGEPVLVVAAADRIERLRSWADHDLVTLADRAQVGRNPSRIIPAWHALVDAHPGRAVRGVGEPISAVRADGADLVEHQHAEALLNVAFAEADGFWLRCPYDVSDLSTAIIDEAERSHPIVVDGRHERASQTYPGVDAIRPVLDEPLPEPPRTAVGHVLRPGRLAQLRAFVRAEARSAGLAPERVDDLVLAANEVASNSLMYAGGGADVRMWVTAEGVVCDIRDGGSITDPLMGRMAPGADEHDARGLWIVNEVCDLAQVRSSTAGSVVRLHVRH